MNDKKLNAKFVLIKRLFLGLFLGFAFVPMGAQTMPMPVFEPIPKPIPILIEDSSKRDDNMNITFGFGINYGGLGSNFTYNPVKLLGLFAAVGYSNSTICYNVGTRFRLTKSLNTKFIPFLSLSYGTSNIITVNGASQLDKIFYGFSLGGGFDLHFKRSLLRLLVGVPLSNSQLNNYLNYLQEQGVNVTSNGQIQVSIGYGFII